MSGVIVAPFGALQRFAQRPRSRSGQPSPFYQKVTMDGHLRDIPTHRSRGTTFVPTAADVEWLSDVMMRRRARSRATSRWLRPLLLAVGVTAAVAVLLDAGGLL